jgi:hypothetical protein
VTDAVALHRAFVAGDLDGVKAALGDPPDFPDCPGPPGLSENLIEYAIYHSPMEFIRALINLGANVNYDNHAGFPSVIAALSTERPDRALIIELLLDNGANIQEKGVNGWTPLHYAAATNDLPMIELLMKHGADPNARTEIDDCATPLDEAEILGKMEAVALLRRLTQ